ncbi:hypothetical protein P4S64_06185 [Vibrio sp. M60_M31a]
MTAKKAAELKALVKVVSTRVNVGSHPEFIVDDQGEYQMNTITSDIKLRAVKYTRDEVVEKFPLLVASSRLADVLEMNLFLTHRYIGQYSIKSNTQSRRDLTELEAIRVSAGGARIDIATVEASAKHLAAFLRWLIDNDVDWAESLSEPLNERVPSLEPLPIWRFRQDLIDQVSSGQLSYNYASNRIQVVKTFYEWAWKNHRIQSVPFKHIMKTIRKRGSKRAGSNSTSLGSLLFGMGNGPTKKGDSCVHNQLGAPEKDHPEASIARGRATALFAS